MIRNLLVSLFSLLPILVLAEKSESATQPNIVFILSDDMGYGDLKCYNPDSRIDTPHLDRLAAEGMIFTDAHSGGPTCVPSRYALLSGEFAARAENLSDRKGVVLPEGRPTVASHLRDAGYRTVMVGTWHLGFEQNGDPEGAPLDAYRFDPENLRGGPVDRGFESFFGIHASTDIPPYFYIKDRKATAAPNQTIKANDSMDGEEGWNHIQGAFWREGLIGSDLDLTEVTPRFQSEACSVIENHDQESPLFLYLALPSPHTPWLPTEEFAGTSKAGMYGDFVAQVDGVVGAVMESLKKSGLSDDTLLIFSSDNGPVWYEKDVERFDHRSVGNLRGVKGSVWEGGHRMPFLVRWPAKVRAGSQTDRTIEFADLFTTVAELAGKPERADGVARDSVSFAPLLLNPDAAMEPRPPILHLQNTIRDGNWKLIEARAKRGFGAPKGKNEVELYRLDEDPGEQNNLAESIPEKVEELRRKKEALLQ